MHTNKPRVSESSRHEFRSDPRPALKRGQGDCCPFIQEWTNRRHSRRATLSNLCQKPGIFSDSDQEMRLIMRSAVNRVYRLLVLKVENPTEYERQIRFGERYTERWDDSDTV